MYAIFEDGGKQYKVSEGDALLIERRELEADASGIQFDKVMMVGEGDDARIGTPWVEGATISATIERELKMPKINIIKFRRRKGFLRRQGHRQQMIRVHIDKINA